MHLPTRQDGVENRHKVYSEKGQYLETLMQDRRNGDNDKKTIVAVSTNYWLKLWLQLPGPVVKKLDSAIHHAR